MIVTSDEENEESEASTDICTDSNEDSVGPYLSIMEEEIIRSAPETITLSGKDGLNSEMSGKYTRGPELHEDRVFYKQPKSNWVIRWHAKTDCWLIDWRGLLVNSDGICAGFCKDFSSHPGACEGPWLTFDGKSFIENENIKIAETIESSWLDPSEIEPTNAELEKRTPMKSQSVFGDTANSEEETKEPLRGVDISVSILEISRSRKIISFTDANKSFSSHQGDGPENTLEKAEKARPKGRRNSIDAPVFDINHDLHSALSARRNSIDLSRHKRRRSSFSVQSAVDDLVLTKRISTSVDMEMRRSSVMKSKAQQSLVLDEYGFIAKDKTSPKSKIDPSFNLQREKKWRRMLFGKNAEYNFALGNRRNRESIRNVQVIWNDVVSKDKKLKSRIRKGVPDLFRGEVWSHCSKSRLSRYEFPNVYIALSKSKHLSEFEKQIDKDIKRTYRKHHAFKDEKSTLQTSLKNVLTCYSLHNTRMGYSQSMSYVGALTLMYMEEEDAFWTLHQLATDEKFEMESLWSETMPLLDVRFHQLTCLVKKHLPKLHARFQEMGIQPAMYQATQWFTTIFLATDLPFCILVRIWDIFLYEGFSFVFRVALSLLKKIWHIIEKSDDEGDVWETIRIITTLVDDSIIKDSFKFRVTQKELDEMQSEYFEKSTLDVRVLDDWRFALI